METSNRTNVILSPESEPHYNTISMERISGCAVCPALGGGILGELHCSTVGGIRFSPSLPGISTFSFLATAGPNQQKHLTFPIFVHHPREVLGISPRQNHFRTSLTLVT
jgi:hypothetical protein